MTPSMVAIVENCNASLGPKISAITPSITGVIIPLRFPNIEKVAIAVPLLSSIELFATYTFPEVR